MQLISRVNAKMSWLRCGVANEKRDKIGIASISSFGKYCPYVGLLNSIIARFVRSHVFSHQAVVRSWREIPSRLTVIFLHDKWTAIKVIRHNYV